MNKKITIIIFITLISLLSTGCWNYRELSDIAIITGVGIDKEDNDYKVSLLISNTTDSVSSSEIGAKATIITGKGSNINEAFDDARLKSSKDIYVGHISLLLISEEIARDGIYDIIDPVFRDPESIKKVNLVIIKNTTSNDVLKILSPLDMYPSQNIILNIENTILTVGTSYNTHVSDFIYRIINYGIDNIVPTIIVEGETEEDNSIDQLKKTEIEKYIKIDDLALFREYKLIDYANTNESKAINVISNKATNVTITTKCYKDLDKYIVIKLNDPKTKIDFNIKNNKIKYTFNIKTDALISETNCKLELRDEEVMKNITNYARSELYEIVKKTIKKTQNINTDVLGLGNLIYKKDFKYWHKIKDNWREIYPNIEFTIKIDLNISEKGALQTTIKEEDK